MHDEKKQTPNWNPPSPPWESEPQPLETIPDKNPDPETEPEPVNMGLEDKIEEMVESGEIELEPSPDPEAIDPPGLEEYTVKCPTGITVNGKVFGPGVHSVKEDLYETLSKLDAPYN